MNSFLARRISDPVGKDDEILYEIDPTITKCEKCSTYFDNTNVADNTVLCASCSKKFAESMAMPLARVMYPKTISKELITVIPMDKPEIVRGFVSASMKRFGNEQG